MPDNAGIPQDYLSETDVEAIDFVLGKYGHLTPAQLSKLSHTDPAWREADMHGDMDYRLLLVEDGTMPEMVEADQERRDALEPVEVEEQNAHRVLLYHYNPIAL